MALAIQHSEGSIIVQTDSSEALMAMKGDSLRYSAYGHLVAEIRRHTEAREFVPSKIKREQNRIAHRLAVYSRTESTTAVWLGGAHLVLRSWCLSIVTLLIWNKTLLSLQKKS